MFRKQGLRTILLGASISVLAVQAGAAFAQEGAAAPTEEEESRQDVVVITVDRLDRLAGIGTLSSRCQVGGTDDDCGRIDGDVFGGSAV